MPKYIIHIGPPKAGSKYLQSQLFHSRMDLETKGVLYPDVWLKAPNNATLITHVILFHQLRDGKDLKKEFDQLNNSGFETVILSCEGLDALKTPALKRLKEYTGNYPVEVVYYVRRWSERIFSSWRQRVTMGHFVTFPEDYWRIISNPEGGVHLNYSLVWRAYEEIFGRDSLKLVSFSNLVDNKVDLFKHFCEVVVGLPVSPEIDRRFIQQNLGPGIIETEIMRVLNFMYFDQTSRADPTMRIIFNKIKKELDLRTLEDQLKTDIREVQFEESAQYLRPAWNAVSAYRDRLVSPEYGEEFFKQGASRIQYIGQNYLLRKDAADELFKLYNMISKWIGSHELTAQEKAQIELHPQNPTTYARQPTPSKAESRREIWGGR
jgi:hypothetical protein